MRDDAVPRLQNKPNGQFKLEFTSREVKAFMHDLSIRKVQGVGRVNERLLESIGIKVRSTLLHAVSILLRVGACAVGAIVVLADGGLGIGHGLDLRRHLHASRGAVADGQAVWPALPAAGLSRYRLERGRAPHAGGAQEYRCGTVSCATVP